MCVEWDIRIIFIIYIFIKIMNRNPIFHYVKLLLLLITTSAKGPSAQGNLAI